MRRHGIDDPSCHLTQAALPIVMDAIPRLVAVDTGETQPERRPVLLFTFANDERPGRRLGGLGRELEDIRRTLAQAERDGMYEVVVRESTTPAELIEVLEDPRYRSRLTTIHFAGHASGSRLLLEGEDEPVAARIEGLAPLLGELEGLALVFLNGCGTLAQGERLVRAGIPAVIATEHAVEDEQAQRFAVDFYRNVVGGASIAEAFGRAVAEAQCFVPARGMVRDLALAPVDEEPAIAWRLLLADPHGDAKDWSLAAAIDDPLFGLPAAVGGVLPQEPFMGLRRFTARESAVLFGRGRAIRNLYEDVTNPAIPSLVVVYGASGVGKSSLLEAGLLPRLAAAHEVHDLRLERGQDPEALLRRVLGDTGSHLDLATAWLARERDGGRPVVICIDQLEVLMLEDDGAMALARFVRALAPLSGSGRPRGKLLLGLRKEWFPELRSAIKRQRLEWHDHFVEPLGRDDIEEVVLGPTRTASLRARYGITCEDGLARRIADDLSRDRGSAIAPMLQILLTRMWERTEPKLTSVDGRTRRSFTLETYDELRRDGLALSDFVDRQLEALKGGYARALASGLVLELLFRHTTPRGTAASTTHAELREAYAHQWPGVEGIIERCISLYLLQAVADAQGADLGVRLAHDTLAPIVRDRYVRSKAPAQAAARLLEARMGMSESSGRSRLLDEHDLAQVEAAQPGMRRWTEEEARLVEESRRRRKRAVWLRRGLAMVVVSLATAVVALAIRGLDSKDEPVVDRLYATATPLAQEPARSEEGGGIVGAIEPEAPVARPEAAALAGSPATAGSPPVGRQPAVTASGEVTCDLRRIGVASGAATPIETVAVTHDGERLAVGMGERRKAFVLDPGSGSVEPEIGTAREVNRLEWSPDGRSLAIGEEGGRVELVRWDGSSRQAPVSCQAHDNSISALAFSADGAMLLTADGKGRVIARDSSTCKRTHELVLEGAVHDIHELSAGGRSVWLLAGTSGLAEWNGASASVSPRTVEISLRSITSSAGNELVIASGKHLQLWDASGESLDDEKLEHVAPWVFVDARGESVITASSHGVGLWAWSPEAAELELVHSWANESIVDVAVYPDLLDVLVATADGRVHRLARQGGRLEPLESLDVEATGGGELVLDPGLRYLAVGDHAGQVSLITLPTVREQARRCTLNRVP